MFFFSNYTDRNITEVNFENMQDFIKEQNAILINTLTVDQQHCTIIHTTLAHDEENVINRILSINKHHTIVVYGKNSNDRTIYKKYNQLVSLGFYNVYLYPGGIFEWLLLQDIYGEENFPTKGKDLDIIKYKPQKHNFKMLTMNNT